MSSSESSRPARRGAGRRAFLQRGLALAPAMGARLAHLATPAAAPALAAALLAGCGFRLRQPPTMAFDRIALEGFAPRSPMADELRRRLGAGVTVVPVPAQAQLVLQALDDARERSVAASTAAAQVRELQLRLRFAFRAYAPSGRELIPRAELLLTRDLSYIETAALAKEQEESELFREMQADAAEQVLRRLASVRP